MSDKIKALFFLVLFLFINSLILILLLPQRDNLQVNPGLLVKRVKPVPVDLNQNKVESNLIDDRQASKLDGRRVDNIDPYPVAVMIDNHIDARPSAGFSQASFVYETLVEGGATRFLAIFDVENNEIEKIGPVRSARPYFVEWAREYNALYVHAGGSPQALAEIKNNNINDLNEISWYGVRYFYRDYSRKAPHNLFTSTERLKRALEWRKLLEPEYDPWLFTQATSTIGQSAVDVYIDFSPGEAYDVFFVYDKDKNEYLRLDGRGKKWRDSENSQVIAASNIIVQLIPAEELSGGKGRLYLDIYGRGDGLIFQNGVVREIYWQKPDKGMRTKFYYKNEKKEIELIPGLTWIVIVPGEREVKWNSSGTE